MLRVHIYEKHKSVKVYNDWHIYKPRIESLVCCVFLLNNWITRRKRAGRPQACLMQSSRVRRNTIPPLLSHSQNQPNTHTHAVSGWNGGGVGGARPINTLFGFYEYRRLNYVEWRGIRDSKHHLDAFSYMLNWSLLIDFHVNVGFSGLTVTSVYPLKWLMVKS